jgi:hypothetical protein
MFGSETRQLTREAREDAFNRASRSELYSDAREPLIMEVIEELARDKMFIALLASIQNELGQPSDARMFKDVQDCDDTRESLLPKERCELNPTDLLKPFSLEPTPSDHR